MIYLIIDIEMNQGYTTIMHLMMNNYIQIHVKFLIDLNYLDIQFYITRLIVFYFQ